MIKTELVPFRAAKLEKIRTARFLERPNRFLVRCELDGEIRDAFLPNPGRLWEILLPGTPLLLTEDGKSATRKTAYTVIAAKKGDIFILLHTHMTNDAAEWLLRRNKIPGLEGWKIVRREAPVGRSRFDFLLEKGSRKLLLEVKSCTLFGNQLALFPDAPSDRGRKHVEELASLASAERAGALLFVVQSARPAYFLPDFHTDPKFAESLYSHRDGIKLIPLGVSWSDEMKLADSPRLLQIPWEIYEQNSSCSGINFVISGDGDGGFAVSAEAAEDPSPWFKRVRKTGASSGFKVMPVRSAAAGIREINDKLAHMADGDEYESGARIYFFEQHPLKNPAFTEMLLFQRTDNLVDG
ncbi:MAG: DNA/RNA nuclease SfsA [Synergistaceae bacterium]|nr:DNA/RNA nuclease SfsA [Synergistaceae bacterium]